MKSRKIKTNEGKLNVVLAGIRGRRVVDICTEYEINQSQYYK